MGKLKLAGEAEPTPHTHPETDIEDGSLLARLNADETISGRWDFSAGKLRLTQGLDAAKPTTGNQEGQVFWATDTDKLYVWNGTAWKEIGADGVGALGGLQNLVENGGFEENDSPTANTPSGWAQELTPTIGYSTDVAADAAGDRSLYITADAANEGVRQTLRYLKANTQYYVFARARVVSPATARLFTTGAATNLDVSTTSTAWTTLSGAFTTDASGTDVVLRLVVQAGANVFFDDVLVTEGPTVKPFAPHLRDFLLQAGGYQSAPTNFRYARLRMETGRLGITVSNSPSASGIVIFGTPFQRGLVAVANAESSLWNVACGVPSATALTFSIRHIDNVASTTTVFVNWIAIGVG